jgi:hypothetical protein
MDIIIQTFKFQQHAHKLNSTKDQWKNLKTQRFKSLKAYIHIFFHAILTKNPIKALHNNYTDTTYVKACNLRYLENQSLNFI